MTFELKCGLKSLIDSRMSNQSLSNTDWGPMQFYLCHTFMSLFHENKSRLPANLMLKQLSHSNLKSKLKWVVSCPLTGISWSECWIPQRSSSACEFERQSEQKFSLKWINLQQKDSAIKCDKWLKRQPPLFTFMSCEIHTAYTSSVWSGLFFETEKGKRR